MSVRGRVLVVFARSPAEEARAKGFARRDAAPLFAALLDSWARLARAANLALVISTPEACRKEMARLPIGRAADALRAQPDGAFGERLEAAARQAFAAGARSVVLVGGDAPAVPPDEIDRAFAAVERGELVVGPASDGGIGLVGVPEPRTALLRTIRPGETGLAGRLEDAAREAGLASRRISIRDEIDAPADACRLAVRSGSDRLWAPFRALLRDCGRGVAPESSDRPLPAFVPSRTGVPRAPPRAA
jgi:glycosyltransferase A (GT-A) superfamily protein (DUF2064 family)